MSDSKKHIIFIDSDLESQAAFNRIFNSAEIRVSSFASGMAAIQFIKKNGKADLLIIEEHIKPLGALQTLNYLKEQLDYEGEALIISESKEAIYSDTSVYEVISKAFNQEDVKRVSAILKLEDKKERSDVGFYSLAYLTDLSEGDEKFISESILIFNKSVESRILEMTKLLKEKKFKEVSDVAHNIKPSFEMLQNEKGKHICDHMAHFAENKEMEHLISELKLEFEYIQSNLKKDRPELYSEV